MAAMSNMKNTAVTLGGLRRIIREVIAEQSVDEVPAEFANGDIIEDGDTGVPFESVRRHGRQRRMAEGDESYASYDEQMAARAQENPDIVADFDSAEDRNGLLRVKRQWLRKLDNDEIPNSSRLYGLLDWLFERQKSQLMSRHGAGMFQRGAASKNTTAADIRTDQVLRIRDSSGRARARK